MKKRERGYGGRQEVASSFVSAGKMLHYMKIKLCVFFSSSLKSGTISCSFFCDVRVQ